MSIFIFISFIIPLIFINIGILPVNGVKLNNYQELREENKKNIEDNGFILGIEDSNLNKNETSKLTGSIVIKENLDPFWETSRLPVNFNKFEKKFLIEKYDILAKSGVVFDAKNNYFVFNLNSTNRLPIASITKLITAIVFLDNNPSFDKVYEIKREDRREGGRVYVYLGEKILVKDLFYLSLVASANSATVALVRSTGFTEKEFIEKMNEKAKSLGLRNTKFKDVTGLNPDSYSTAEDLAILVKEAISRDEIRKAVLNKFYEFKTEKGRKKTVQSTNHLLNNFPQNGIKLIIGKTGYTDVAGYCFVGGFKNKEGQELIVVVLGSNSSFERFEEVEKIVKKVFGVNIKNE